MHAHVPTLGLSIYSDSIDLNPQQVPVIRQIKCRANAVSSIKLNMYSIQLKVGDKLIFFFFFCPVILILFLEKKDLPCAKASYAGALAQGKCSNVRRAFGSREWIKMQSMFLFNGTLTQYDEEAEMGREACIMARQTRGPRTHVLLGRFFQPAVQPADTVERSKAGVVAVEDGWISYVFMLVSHHI